VTIHGRVLVRREAIDAGQHSLEHLSGVADGCARESVEADAARQREARPAEPVVDVLRVMP
jgi:hypothetical protein